MKEWGHRDIQKGRANYPQSSSVVAISYTVLESPASMNTNYGTHFFEGSNSPIATEEDSLRVLLFSSYLLEISVVLLYSTFA